MHITIKSFSPTVSESERTISTPLDRPPTASFASLALGGESLNGWDGVLYTFVNKTPLLGVAPQEDDDDEPLPLWPVSTSFYCLSPSAAHDTGC